MAIVYLGLGSNIEPVANLQLAVSELRSAFGDIVLSKVYKSKPLGFEGADFLNLVARIETELKPRCLLALLDGIHDKSGRKRGSARFISRPLDIDILLYDRLVVNEPPVHVPRKDVLEYSFVLIPLAEIAGDYVHPVSERSITAHAADFDVACHPLQQQDVML